MIRGHGNDTYNLSGQITADFSSNVWYKAVPELLSRDIIRSVESIRDYPDPEGMDLKKEIAHFHSISESNIWVNNGSIEGIYLLAQTFAQKKSALVFPGFSEYEDACIRYNHQLSYYSNTENWFEQGIDEDLVWVGNPNNPDGKTFAKKTIEKLLIENPNTVFIMDEAFADLCFNFESCIGLIPEYKNLVVLRSFTKTFTIPGIRLGYVLANKKTISGMRENSIPWSVNKLAIEAGKSILRNYAAFYPNPEELRELSTYMLQRLAEYDRLKVLPSKCNFMLIKLDDCGSSAEVKEFLLQNFNILIRDASNFRGLNNKFIRLSIQSRKNIDMLMEAFKVYFNGSC